MSAAPKEAWWTPKQVALVEDISPLWQKQIFLPADAVKELRNGVTLLRKIKPGEQLPPMSSILPKGWDHAHCSLCWKKISALPETEHSGYTDQERWLCETCYEMYLAPRQNPVEP